MIRLALPYPISANRYWQSFVPPGSRIATVHLSSEAKAYKREVQWMARKQGVRAPITGRLQVELFLTPHRPLDAIKRMQKAPMDWDMTVRCIDAGNAEKVAMDALQGIVFANDAQIHRLVVERCEPGAAGLVVQVQQWVPPWLRQAALFDEATA